jgi:hypothetical protein
MLLNDRIIDQDSITLAILPASLAFVPRQANSVGDKFRLNGLEREREVTQTSEWAHLTESVGRPTNNGSIEVEYSLSLRSQLAASSLRNRQLLNSAARDEAAFCSAVKY